MWTMGADGWIQYGWGKTMEEEWCPGSQLTIDLRNRSRSTKITPLVAAKKAVDNIVKNYPAPYTLMCSGGADSQAMLYAWHVSGYPYEVCSFQYKSEGEFFNDYDLIPLEKLSTSLGIQVKYIELDLIHFLRNDLAEVAKTNDCDSPQICTYIKFTESIKEGTVLFSGNYLTTRAVVNYTLLGLHRHSLIRKGPGQDLIPFFFLHDPMLSTAFLDFGAKNTETAIVYQKSGFPIVPPERKFNGFEKIKEYFDKYNNDISGAYRLQYADKPSKRAFDLLFRHPYEGQSRRYKDSIPLNQIL